MSMKKQTILEDTIAYWVEDMQRERLRADIAEEKLAIVLEALRRLDRRGDSLETFDSVVHEIVSTTLAQLKE